MFPMDFFSKEDRQVKDKCPVCRYNFGKVYIKTERIYFCNECKWMLEFHPFDETPRMFKLKKTSRLDEDYQPYEEDIWMIEEIHLPEDPQDPPQGPRRPPWYI